MKKKRERIKKQSYLYGHNYMYDKSQYPSLSQSLKEKKQ
jgi:hypothetical protein